MSSFDEHSNEMLREEQLFDEIHSKMKNHSTKQLIEFGAKSIADIFNAIAIDDIRSEKADFTEEDAVDYVALVLISYGGLIIGDSYCSRKRNLIEKMFKKAASLIELASAEDLKDICEALFENEITVEENAEIFHLLYSDAKDYGCDLAHRLYIIGLAFAYSDRLDESMLKRCKEQLEVMGLHRYVNHKFDMPFMRDTKTGESYYSCDIDIGGESA